MPTPDEVGEWRYCPACGHRTERDNFGEHRCVCCYRLWQACPCTPADDGPCRSLTRGHP